MGWPLAYICCIALSLRSFLFSKDQKIPLSNFSSTTIFVTTAALNSSLKNPGYHHKRTCDRQRGQGHDWTELARMQPASGRERVFQQTLKGTQSKVSQSYWAVLHDLQEELTEGKCVQMIRSRKSGNGNFIWLNNQKRPIPLITHVFLRP